MDENEPIVYIKKEEFQKKLLELNLSLGQLGLVYTRLYIKEKNVSIKKWLQVQINEIAADIQTNDNILRRSEIENGYLVFWSTAGGNMALRRCTREEYRSIYGRKLESKVYS